MLGESRNTVGSLRDCDVGVWGGAFEWRDGKRLKIGQTFPLHGSAMLLITLPLGAVLLKSEAVFNFDSPSTPSTPQH